MTPKPTRSAWTTDALVVAATVSAGAALRWWLATKNAGITMDSPLYVIMAEAMRTGEKAIGPAHHGYSALIAAVGLLVPGRELPGRLLSFAAGLALIPLVYLLVRRAASRPWAAAAAGLVALHPLLAVYAGPIMTESTYLALATAGLLLLERGRRMAGGSALGLAYAVRPEALVIAPVAALLARGGARGVVRVLAGFALIVGPYVGYLSWQHGEPTLSPKSVLVRPPFEDRRQAEWRVGAAVPVEPKRSLIERVRWAGPEVMRQYLPRLKGHAGRMLEVWPWPLMALSAVGLVARLGPLAAALAPLLVLPLLAVAVDLRFSQLFVPALAAYAAIGAGWWTSRWPARARVATAGAAMLMVAGLALVWMSRPGRIARHFDDGPMEQMRAAGEWLRANGRPGATVMDRKAYVPFFAGMHHVQLPDDDYDTVVEFARRSGVDYLVIEEFVIERLRPQFRPLADDPEFQANERRLRMIFGIRGGPYTGIAVLQVERDSTRARTATP
jgi:hypothetical protein